MSKKITYTLILILLIEFFYIGVDGVNYSLPSGGEIKRSNYSIGFPSRSLEVETEKTKGNIPLSEYDPENIKFVQSVNISPFIIIDMLVVAGLLGICLKLIPYDILKTISIGVLMGLLTNLLIVIDSCHFSNMLTTCAILFTIFMLLPLIIYIRSPKNEFPNRLIIMSAFSIILGLILSDYILHNILLNPALEWSDSVSSDSILIMFAYFGILLFECFIINLIHKKIIPLIWKR